MARIDHKDIGDIWQPQASFTVATTPTDPTVITTRVMAPSGTLTTASYTAASLTSVSTPLAKTTTGTFVLSHSLTEAGHWYSRFEGTGAVTASEDFEVIADPSPFYSSGGVSIRALVAVGETKDWLAEQDVDTSDDLKIVQGINAASERIMQVAGREFKPRTAGQATRAFDIPLGRYTVEIGDIATLSSASTSATITDFETGTTAYTFASTDFVGLPRNPLPWQPYHSLKFRSIVWNYLRPTYVLNVTGYWGFPTVPEDVKHATMDAVAYWLDRDVEHFRQDLGVGNVGEAGQTVFLGGAPPTVFPLPPESYRIATSYRRQLVAV